MSETEVSIRDNQLEALAAEITELFDGLPKSKKREDDLGAIQLKLDQFQSPLDTMHLDLKTLDLTVKKRYMQKWKAHRQHKKDWETRLESERKFNTREQLMDGHAVEKKGADFDTADGLMQHGAAVQADTKEAIARGQAVVKDARDLGVGITTRLDAQNKQTANMIDDLASIDNTLTRANKTLRRIARKIGTDKYLWVLIFLVIVAVIFIIVWKSTH